MSYPTLLNLIILSSVDFGFVQHLVHVAISSSGSGIIGESYSLTCTVILVDPVPLPSDVPPPTFEWFFGLNGSISLSSGVIPMANVTASSNNSINITYTSTLEFSPLIQSHAGMYTCRLGAGSLINSIVVTVNGNADDYFLCDNNKY